MRQDTPESDHPPLAHRGHAAAICNRPVDASVQWRDSRQHALVDGGLEGGLALAAGAASVPMALGLITPEELRLTGGTGLASVVSSWSFVDKLIAGYLAFTAPALAVAMVQDAYAAGPWSKFAIGYAFKMPCSARTGKPVYGLV